MELSQGSAREREVVLRDPCPGDLGWIVMQHGEVSVREFGFTPRFEPLIAGIAARVVDRLDARWEKGWIAEVDGQRAGSVFCTRRSATVAQLRLLIVAPPARRLGLGSRLTDECITFARARGYRKMVLWTHGHLERARAIYESRGFRLTRSESTVSDLSLRDALVDETWELKL